ncbi:hypothetical protein SF83666_c35240 [Sinorhizobium fredii CCBAU 83666]|nr:hypothetical protein SF83666_c35240 [Sinorhizobium fredii CCBAU 83666]
MEAEPRGSSARFLSPAVPGRERRARDVRRFSSSFWPLFCDRARKGEPARHGPAGSAQRWTNCSVASDVSSFAAALTGFSARVKPPAALRLELPGRIRASVFAGRARSPR